MRTLLTFLLPLVFVVPALAQETVVVLDLNNLALAWDHDNVDMDPAAGPVGFAIYVNGTRTDLGALAPAATLPSGELTYQTQVAPLVAGRGVYTFEVVAYNASGDSEHAIKEARLIVRPNQPGSPRFVEIAP